MDNWMNLDRGREFTSRARCLHARSRKAQAARGSFAVSAICVGNDRPIYLSWCTELHFIDILCKSFAIFNNTSQIV